MQETWVPFLGQEDLLEKGMATHSSIFAWQIPWTEEPGQLQSMGSQRVGHQHTAQGAKTSHASEPKSQNVKQNKFNKNFEKWKKVKVKVAQLCPTLCNPMGFVAYRTLQARILEWVAFPFSRGSSEPGIQLGCPALQAILYQLRY